MLLKRSLRSVALLAVATGLVATGGCAEHLSGETAGERDEIDWSRISTECAVDEDCETVSFSCVACCGLEEDAVNAQDVDVFREEKAAFCETAPTPQAECDCYQVEFVAYCSDEGRCASCVAETTGYVDPDRFVMCSDVPGGPSTVRDGGPGPVGDAGSGSSGDAGGL